MVYGSGKPIPMYGVCRGWAGPGPFTPGSLSHGGEVLISVVISGARLIGGEAIAVLPSRQQSRRLTRGGGEVVG